MAPKSKLAATKAKAAQNAVKEKVFHPQSRKAGQMERASLRKGKLAGQSHRRSKKQLEKGTIMMRFIRCDDRTEEPLFLEDSRSFCLLPARITTTRACPCTARIP